jgi:hypothetical protein
MRSLRFRAAGRIGLVALLWVGGAANAHDWRELQDSTTVEEARLALEVARQVVDDAADSYAGPRLPADALASDWFRWFTGIAELGSRAGQRRLTERLVAAGFVEPGLEDIAVEEWRHVAGHVAQVFDAERLAPGRAEIDAAVERLSTIELGDDTEAHLEAARLSYIVGLGGVTRVEREALAPLLPAVEALVEQARHTGSEP